MSTTAICRNERKYRNITKTLIFGLSRHPTSELQNIWKMWNIHFRKKCLILMFLRIKFSTPYWKKNQFGQFLHIVHWVAAILEKRHGLPLQMVSENSEKKSQFIWPKMAQESKRATWKSKKVGKWNTLL